MRCSKGICCGSPGLERSDGGIAAHRLPKHQGYPFNGVVSVCLAASITLSAAAARQRQRQRPQHLFSAAAVPPPLLLLQLPGTPTASWKLHGPPPTSSSWAAAVCARWGWRLAVGGCGAAGGVAGGWW